MSVEEEFKVGLEEVFRRWQAVKDERDYYRTTLEKIDLIPWDSQASAQMRTYAHFALENHDDG